MDLANKHCMLTSPFVLQLGKVANKLVRLLVVEVVFGSFALGCACESDES